MGKPREMVEPPGLRECIECGEDETQVGLQQHPACGEFVCNDCVEEHKDNCEEEDEQEDVNH